MPAPRQRLRQYGRVQSAILGFVVGAARADAEERQSAVRRRTGDADRRLYRADAHARRSSRIWLTIPEIAAEPARRKQSISRPPRSPQRASLRTRNPTDGKPVVAKPTDGEAAHDGKATAGTAHWTPMSSSALAASPPPDLKADAAAGAPAAKKPPKPKPTAPGPGAITPPSRSPRRRIGVSRRGHACVLKRR